MTKATSKDAPRIKGVYEKTLGSGVWWIRFADVSGKIRRELAGTKANADKLYKVRKAAVLQKQKLPFTLKTKPVTFADLSKKALEYSVPHKKSAGDDQERMEILNNLFGSSPAEDLRPGDIEKHLLRASKERKWKPATFNRYKALVSLVYRVGLENGKVSHNPARLVRRLKENNAVIRFLSDKEELRLKGAIQPEHPDRWATIEFALHTGLRAGEQWRLKWQDVDLKSIQPQITLRETKNGSIRHVPLNATAVDALKALKGAKKPADFVFPRQHYRGWFDIALTAAEVEDFTWHCLRHTFASRLVMSGADLRTIAELLGHRSMQMVMRYTHLAPEHKAAAVAKLVSTATSTKTDTSAKTSLSTETQENQEVIATVAVVS